MSDYSTVAPPQSNINQSQAFAAALQRAKQIAAKIQPTGQQQQPQPQQQLQGSGGGYKRSLNDDDSAGPDAKKFSSPDSYNSQQGGNMSQALAQAAAVAARLAATAGNTTEEQLRIPEAIVGHLVVGRNSSDNISHIQAESGCKIQLSQESERTVTVRGSRDAVTKGREMIQQMATQHGGTVEIVLSITMPPPGPTGYPPYQEIMVPGAKVGLVIGKGGETIKMLQEKTGAKMVIIQDGPNQEVIKPLRISGDPQKIEQAKSLVFELIQDKDNVRPGGFNNANGAGGESAEVFVPKVAVGVVIGKGGDMIKKIQGETGCKLQFIQGKNDEPGDRRCIIQGSRQQVEDAKHMIEGLIESVMQRSQANNNRNNNAAGGGGGGGNGQGQADNANSNYGYGYGVNHTQQAPREEVTFSVPASKCGIVIGRGGETIKLINQQTGAYCEMDRSAVNPPSEKMFKAKGTPEQIEHARQMISEKINIDLVILSRKPIGNAPNHQQNSYNNNGGMQSDPNAAAYQQQWAGYAAQGGWDQSQQQQQQQQMNPMAQASAAGQADYSTQWIEYYKSMGMHREAEMIEQQLKAKQAMGGVGPTNPAMPAAAPQMAPQPQVQPQQQPQQQVQQQTQGQAPDYSAQWAEYYRSIGKIEEAEAIEKQMGKGVPSNGQASAQPSVSAPTQPAAAAAAPQQPVAGGYPQGMTPSQYAQYSQYYAAAAAAGQPGGYPQQAYPGYGYPGGPQPGMPGGPQSGAGGPPNPQQQQHKQQNNKPNDKK